MELTFACPSCGVVNGVDAVETVLSASCRACETTHELHPESFDSDGLRSCAWCATEDLYVQKDFPQGLGLLIVVAGFVVSTVFWYEERPIPAYLVLLASALLDLVLYYRVPGVTICYRCLGQFRGAGCNPGGRFRPFDLAVGERYRQERLRVEQLRARDAQADTPHPPLTPSSGAGSGPLGS
jgi:hypothetical protein